MAAVGSPSVLLSDAEIRSLAMEPVDRKIELAAWRTFNALSRSFRASVAYSFYTRATVCWRQRFAEAIKLPSKELVALPCVRWLLHQQLWPTLQSSPFSCWPGCRSDVAPDQCSHHLLRWSYSSMAPSSSGMTLNLRLWKRRGGGKHKFPPSCPCQTKGLETKWALLSRLQASGPHCFFSWFL